MKKKSFMVLALFLVLVLLVVGCSSGKEPAKEPAQEPAKEPVKEEVKEVYKIKLGHSNPATEENIIHLATLKFAELASQYTDGRVIVEEYPSNQLGDELDQMRSMQNGTQEMVFGSVQNYGTFSPSVNYLALPYIFTGIEQANKALEELWDKNTEFMVTQGNLRPLAWTVAGFRNLSTDKKHPVRSLADAKGLKIRIPPNPVSEAAFKEFGFEPIAMPFSEVFPALQQGVAVGQENCYTTIRAEHYDEVQKYVTDIQWMYTIGIFAISEEYFQKLPKDVQEALIKAGKEATKYEMELFATIDAGDVKYLQEKGMEFLGVPTDYEQWVEKGRSIWPSQYKLIGGGDEAKGKEIVDSVLEIIK